MTRTYIESAPEFPVRKGDIVVERIVRRAPVYVDPRKSNPDTVIWCVTRVTAATRAGWVKSTTLTPEREYPQVMTLSPEAAAAAAALIGESFASPDAIRDAIKDRMDSA